MGNMGAFITITGNNLKPNYKSFEAAVSRAIGYLLSQLIIAIVSATSRRQAHGLCQQPYELAGVVSFQLTSKAKRILPHTTYKFTNSLRTHNRRAAQL